MHNDALKLDHILKLQVFPSDLQNKVKELVTEYWDLFCEDGLLRPIWGFSFQIDIGNPPTHMLQTIQICIT